MHNLSEQNQSTTSPALTHQSYLTYYYLPMSRVAQMHERVVTSTPIQTSPAIENHVAQNESVLNNTSHDMYTSVSRSPSVRSDENNVNVVKEKCMDCEDCDKWCMSECHCATTQSQLKQHQQLAQIETVNEIRPQTRRQEVESTLSVDPFATDVPAVKASDISEKHWHLLRRFVGNKRQCTFCKKAGIIVYKGELFLPEGSVEMNSCARCGRTFGQVSPLTQQRVDEKNKVKVVTTPVKTISRQKNSWFGKFNY